MSLLLSVIFESKPAIVSDYSFLSQMAKNLSGLLSFCAYLFLISKRESLSSLKPIRKKFIHGIITGFFTYNLC